jgi:hypothetical protein
VGKDTLAMREIVLRDFFLGSVTPSALAQDISGSKKKIGPVTWLVEIEDMESDFSVTREMLVSLCNAVLSGQIPAEELSTIGFALVASDNFKWDGEDIVGDVIHDWSCPEVNYPLTVENLTRFKNWLLELDPYPPRPSLKHPGKDERLVSRTEKKWLPKQSRDKNNR